MKDIVSVCIVILLGISILLGLFVFKYNKDYKKLYSFIESMSIISLILLVVFYLLPECINFLGKEYNIVQSYAYLFLMLLLGIFILRMVLYFLSKDKNKSKDLSYSHVILLIIISILLFIEGALIYNAKSSWLSLSFLSIKFLLYNTILGITLSSDFKKKRFSIKKCVKYLFIISIFSLISYLLSYNNNFIYKNTFIIGSLLGVLIGMICYIIVKVYVLYFKNNNNSSAKTIGLIIGGVIFLLSNLL